jgi:hypothetical protein
LRYVRQDAAQPDIERQILGQLFDHFKGCQLVERVEAAGNLGADPVDYYQRRVSVELLLNFG